MASPFSGDYNEGDLVQCQRCAKNVRVKYYDRDTVVIVSTQEQQTLALRCQYCGYVMCDSCAHPAESLFPICPSCQREWGPYYFTHEAISPSLSKAAIAADTPPTAKPPLPPPPEVKDAPPAQVETLAAGEVDLFREEMDRRHSNLIRRTLFLLLIILLLGAGAYTAFGRGGSWLKKGLSILSSRPTHSPTTIVAQNGSLINPTATKPTSPTPKVSLSDTRLSSTPAASTGTNATSKAGVALTPTKKITTTTIPLIPSATYTLIPTPIPITTNQSDCVQALSVTLVDVGKTLCVMGTVEYTTQKGNSFSIYFSKDEGYFRIVVYDRVPNGIKKGVCVKVTGVIKELLNGPVIAPGYNDVIEICSQ